MYGNKALVLRCLGALVAMAVLAGISGSVASAEDRPGAVYVLTNQPTGNSVMVYARAADGTLSFSGSFSTGGKGAGTGADPLGSQGSLVLGRWRRLLFAVNAGSNDLSLFAVGGLRLRLLDRVASGGQMPVSVAVHGHLVYVLNAGGTPNVKGFVLEPCACRLVPLLGSKRTLPGGSSSSPAEVAFSPDGDSLMVTEKGTNKIDTWTVNDEGFAENGTTTDSSGATPFGFTFVHDFAIVSEAGPSALSSYELEDNAHLQLLTASLADTQKANCWVLATKNTRYAYTTNTGSGTISSYSIARGGTLSLLSAIAANTGAGTAPVDMALSDDGRFLYAREAVKGKVDVFRVESDGSLTPIGSAGGVPAGAQGVAAR